VAAVGAFAAWRSPRITIILALADIPIVWTLRIARELHGRPGVGAIGWTEVALTSLIGIGLLYGLRNADPGVRVFVAFLTAFGALYQGLTMYPVLTHAIALTLLPTTASRAGVALALSLGEATLAGSWKQLAGERRPHDKQPLTRRRKANRQGKSRRRAPA
jgi:hypothetical protein